MASIVTFMPIQPGEGTPSLENIRPIYPPLYIDGIGPIYGGTLNPNTGELIETWNKVIYDGVNNNRKYNSDYTNATYLSVGIVYVSPQGKPDNYTYTRYLCDSMQICGPAFSTTIIPRTRTISAGALYLTTQFGLIEDYPELDTGQKRIAFGNEYLKAHPMSVVYELRTPNTYHLTADQLAQAIQQLGIQMPTALEKRRSIIMQSPHIVTPESVDFHTFETDMVAPLRECRVHFSPVQEGTGDPSPSNVRAIHGWTGVEVEQKGKNLLNMADFIGVNQYINASGQIKSEGPFSYTKQLTLSAGTYVISGVNRNTINSNVRVHSYDANGVWQRQIAYQGKNQNDLYNLSFIVLPTDIFIRISAPALTTESPDFQLEFASTPTAYEPYRGQTVPINWESIGEIPGGYVDLTGELVADKFLLVFDGTEDWKRNGSTTQRYYYYVNISESAVAGECICSHEIQKALSVNNTTLGCNMANVSNVMSFLIRLSADTGAMSSVEDFKAWVAAQYANGTPLTAVGTFAVPIRYPIDPITLKTLRGVNNIWSNANGNIELSYWKH